MEINFSKELFVEPPTTIEAYLRSHVDELGARILEFFPPLQGAQDSPSPLLAKLLRRPYASQSVAIMGVVKKLAAARSAWQSEIHLVGELSGEFVERKRGDEAHHATRDLHGQGDQIAVPQRR